MPETATIARARRAKAEGKSPSTQAGEFVREEIHKIRRGAHGARSPEQAIAIGLSMARRAGVKLPPPKHGKAATRRKARQDLAAGRTRHRPSPRRSRARVKALRHEPITTVSARALSAHARQAAQRRGPADLVRAAKKAAQTRRSRSVRDAFTPGSSMR